MWAPRFRSVVGRFAIPLASVVILLMNVKAIGFDEQVKASATPKELSASDLARALGVEFWSYRLSFDRVVKRVTIQPCELSRKADGTWQRQDLGTGESLSGRELRSLDVALIIPESSDGKRYAVKLGDTAFSRKKFSRPPDLSNSITSAGGAQFVGDCLVLAHREANSSVITGREENMVWLFALRVIFDGDE